MMEALISGQAALAVLIEGDTARYFNIDTPSNEVQLNTTMISNLFIGATDVIEIKTAFKKDVIERLNLEWQRDRALHLTLILLDSTEDKSNRELAAECLAELTVIQDVIDFVVNRLYSAPLPETADITCALLYTSNLSQINNLLQELHNAQDQIRKYRESWDSLPSDLFGDSKAKEEFKHLLTNLGGFKLLAQSGSDTSKFGLALVNILSSLQSLPYSRQVIQSWLEPLQPPKEEHDFKKILAKSDNRGQEEPKGGIPQSYDRQDVIKKVNRQKDLIIQQIEEGKWTETRVIIEQLVRYQLNRGGTKYAVMSLCDIAQTAKNHSNYSFQLEITQWAVKVAPDDGWAHGQLADAYYCLNQYDNALNSFKNAARMGSSGFGATGIALILRGQGKFEQALNAYRQACDDFSENATAWNGVAEVYRDLGQYDDALKAYEIAIKKFPYDPVSHCGKANLLKIIGSMDEAKEIYKETVSEFPEDVYPLSGYAGLLKEIGDWTDALQVYNDAISKFPNDCFLQNARADVLNEMGLFEKAREAYLEVEKNFPLSPVAWSGRAEVLRGMGKLDDAFKTYDIAIGKFPNDSRLHNGRANVLKLLGKLKESLQAYDENVARFPYDSIAWSGRADLLKRLGALEKAVEAYKRVINLNPTSKNAQYAQAAILTAMGKYQEAESLLPSSPPRTREEWIANHIRGMILIKTDKLEAAAELFRVGLESIPFADDRKYFSNALAIVTLRQKKFILAAKHISNSTEPLENVLCIHAYGALDMHNKANEAYKRVVENCPLNLKPLRDELAARYVLQTGTPSQTWQWIFEEECKILLLEVA